MNADSWDEEAEEARLRDMEREWADATERGPDYYKLLNVSRHASTEDVRDSYKRLSLLFHPDRHHDSERRTWAQRQFQSISRAYEVLVDPRTRAAYDQLGEEGVQLSKELGHKVQSPRDLLAVFEHRARRQRIEEIELWAQSNSEIVVDMDTSWLFSLSERKLVSRARRPAGQTGCVNSLLLRHSFSADLARNLTGTVTGQMFSSRGRGAGTAIGTLKYTPSMSSEASISMPALPPYMLTFKGVHHASLAQYYSAEVKQHTLDLLTPPLATVVCARELGGVTGRLTMCTGNRYTLGPFWAHSPTRFWHEPSGAGTASRTARRFKQVDSSVSIGLMGSRAEHGGFYVDVGAGIKHSWVNATYTRNLDSHFSLTGGLTVIGAGRPMPRDAHFRIDDGIDSHDAPAAAEAGSGLESLADLVLKLDMTGTLDSWTKLEWNISISLASGVKLTIVLHRLRHQIQLPILLTPLPEVEVAALAALLPMAAALGVHYAVLRPRRRRTIQQRMEELKEEQRYQLHQQRLQAEEAVRLLTPGVERSRAASRAADGLVIERALYGDLPFDIAAQNSNSLQAALDHFWNSRAALSDTDKQRACDVTLALHALVTDNQLVIATGGGKYSLPGFYDPAFGVDKSLFVSYRFRGMLHEVIVKDDEALAIPMKAHSIVSQP
ncbi:hypothetical protein IWW50_002151 [Coemansia erecta]|nr:hypothetical protein GGF43_002485 [Coemansia sp. RSA 2618]KAJ2826886.1 hypothetical protein IWW50_002151 [Coemansia erecta]